MNARTCFFLTLTCACARRISSVLDCSGVSSGGLDISGSGISLTFFNVHVSHCRFFFLDHCSIPHEMMSGLACFSVSVCVSFSFSPYLYPAHLRLFCILSCSFAQEHQ